MRMSHTVLLSIACIALAVYGAPVSASGATQTSPAETLETEGAPPQASADAQPQEDRVICTREKPIGSNHTKRVCRQASEMKTLRGDTQGAIRNNNRPMGQKFDVP